MRDKRYYEEIIEQTTLFGLDPKKEPAAYKQEKNRLAKTIFLYKTTESAENSEFGLEIMETFCNCVKTYDPSKGPFLHYFNHSFMRCKAKNAAVVTVQRNSGGIHFSESENKTAGVLHNYLQTHNGITKEDLLNSLEKYADYFGMTPEELKKSVRIYEMSFSVSGDMDISENGEVYTFFERLASNTDFVEAYIQEDEVHYAIDIAERAFLQSREKTKKLLSFKLTALFAELDCHNTYLDTIKKKAFFNDEIYQIVVESNKKFSNKTISKMLDLTEPNITQIWKRFVEKCRVMAKE